MIGGMLIIFLLIPESPWWLVGQEKRDKAAKVLTRFNGHIEGYNVQEVIVRVPLDLLGFSFIPQTPKLTVFVITEYHVGHH